MMADVAQRIVLLVVAVLAAAWLAVGLYSSRLLARAENPHPGDTVADRVDRLHRAEFLNPSTEFQVREAQIRLESGDARDATRLLKDVVRREPDNRQAWAGLVQSQQSTDLAAARRAFNELRRLVPPVKSPGS
jgi:cytochrome c-type biogenesis protein CcmH/NrfG